LDTQPISISSEPLDRIEDHNNSPALNNSVYDDPHSTQNKDRINGEYCSDREDGLISETEISNNGSPCNPISYMQGAYLSEIASSLPSHQFSPKQSKQSSSPNRHNTPSVYSRLRQEENPSPTSTQSLSCMGSSGSNDCSGDASSESKQEKLVSLQKNAGPIPSHKVPEKPRIKRPLIDPPAPLSKRAKDEDSSTPGEFSLPMMRSNYLGGHHGDFYSLNINYLNIFI
jgi:hypothetical protein